MGHSDDKLSTGAPVDTPLSPPKSLWHHGMKWFATRIGNYSFQLIMQCLAEIWGTALVVIFGNGMAITGVMIGEAMGVVQVRAGEKCKHI